MHVRRNKFSPFHSDFMSWCVLFLTVEGSKEPQTPDPDKNVRMTIIDWIYVPRS